MACSLYVRFLGFAAVVAIALGSACWTQAAKAACYVGAQQLPAQKIADFNASPGQLLTQNPVGGGGMVSEVRDLAASDPATLGGIMGLLPNANISQKRAIGAGLAQAARVCVASDQVYAGKIQQAIADTKDQDLVVAFAAASGDQPIGATGAGAGAGSSGASGGGIGVTTGTGVGGGTVEGIGGNGVNTASFGFTGSAGSANSVSP